MREIERLTLQRTIEARAHKAGLRFGPVDYYMTSDASLRILAARAGLPGRYGFPWVRRLYQRMVDIPAEITVRGERTDAWVSQSITNPLIMARVIAGVCAHADFFDNHVVFAYVPRDADVIGAANRLRIEAIEAVVGKQAVVEFCEKREALIKVTPETPWQRQIAEIIATEKKRIDPMGAIRVVSGVWRAHWVRRLAPTALVPLREPARALTLLAQAMERQGAIFELRSLRDFEFCRRWWTPDFAERWGYAAPDFGDGLGFGGFKRALLAGTLNKAT